MKLTAFFILFLFLLTTEAQVSKVSSLASSNKSDRAKSDSDDDDDSGDGVSFFIDATFGLVGQAQRHVQERRFDEPWINSVEVMAPLGYQFQHDSKSVLPTIRGNWGVVSSEIRWNQLFDETGIYKTFDWQLIQLNFINQPNVRYWFGVGVSVEKETEIGFIEYATALQLHFNNRKINPVTEVRWSRDYETGATPRFEFNHAWGFVIGQTKWTDLEILGGIRYQKYYSQADFTFIYTGLKLNLYRKR